MVELDPSASRSYRSWREGDRSAGRKAACDEGDWLSEAAIDRGEVDLVNRTASRCHGLACGRGRYGEIGGRRWCSCNSCQ